MEPTLTICTGCEMLSKDHKIGDRCPFCDGGKMVNGSGFCIDCGKDVELTFYNAEVVPPLMLCKECGQNVYEGDDPRMNENGTVKHGGNYEVY